MRNKLMILLGLLVIGSGLIYFLLNRKVEVVAPLRVAKIPSNSLWKGGIDGGNWYEIKSITSQSVFRIAIYHDFTGDVEVDTAFILNPSCAFKEIDSLTLINSISGYDGEKILLTLPEKGKRCFLIVK